MTPRGFWARWTGLLDEREPGTALALFRIACGLTVLVAVGSPVVTGIAGDVWLDRADGGYRTLAEPPWLFKLLGGVTPATLWPVLGVLLASALALAVGLGGRVTAFLTLQLYLAVVHINWHTGGCDDLLIGNALWLVVLARSTATLSLDCRLRTGRWTSDTPVYAWPRYLAIFQIVVVYWTTGLQKVSIHWNPAGGFAALYYILQEPSWQRRDMSWLAWVYPLTQVATALTWIWELSAPLLLLALWYRRTRNRPGRLRAVFNWIDFRRLFVAVGLLMHLGVFVLIGLGPFTWITLTFYTCLFRPEEWQAAWRKLRGRSGEPSRTDAEPGPARLAGPTSWRRYLVYGFVTLHVVAISLMAFPAPAGVMDKEDWSNPLAQEEFAAWSARLHGLGLDIGPGDLERWLWDAAERYMDVREKALAPFRPYYKLCGTGQGWRMFVGPNLFPTRLSIEVHEAGRWHPVYMERDPEHTWLGARLDHEHWRTAIFTMAFFQHYKELGQFAHWVARRAARDFPRADEVRVRLYKSRTPMPEEVRADRRPLGRYIKTWTVPLAPLRKEAS